MQLIKVQLLSRNIHGSLMILVFYIVLFFVKGRY